MSPVLLAHYYDHQSELDQEIARQEDQIRSLRQQVPESPLATRLRAQGLLA